MYCRSCGTQNPDDARFCSKCGTKLKEDINTEEKSNSNNDYASKTSDVNENARENFNPENTYNQRINSEGPTTSNSGNIGYQGAGYNNSGYNYNGPRPDIPNYLVWAILSTVFCCLPFGIVAIVYASRVNSNLTFGRIEEAKRASDRAKNWTLAAFICGIIYMILLGIFFVNNM